MKTQAITLLILLTTLSACTQNKQIKQNTMKFNQLTKEEEYVIIQKGTERPFTGKYYDFHEDGTYTCRQCNAPLYRSTDKFDAHCGWPSFDDEIKGAVKRVPDADGSRTEIVCASCGAHLGHVFNGEGFTPKNTRHCVNSVSLGFVPETKAALTDTAIYASGCFWGSEFYLQKSKGVISTEVGYTGGHVEHPTYKQVCTGNTGHAEAVRVVYNPAIISYEDLTKLFFETHDPEQVNRQGPDIGQQYRTAIFYMNEAQEAIAQKLIAVLNGKGLRIATEVTKAGVFWPAEDYHQDYYTKSGGSPYCHIYHKLF
jgi:peptide methionine sulfoxide reductase msrA/msrB